MRTLLAALLTLGIGFTTAARADDAKPTGTYTKTAGDFELKFTFKGDVVEFSLEDSNKNGVTVISKFKLEKDTLKAEITEVKSVGNAQAAVEKGTKYSFKFELKGKKLIVKDLEGEGTAEAKQIVEGEYEKPGD